MNDSVNSDSRQLRTDYARALLIEKLLKNQDKTKFVEQLKNSGVIGLTDRTRQSNILLAIRKLDSKGLESMIRLNDLSAQISRADISTMSKTFVDVNNDLQSQGLPIFDISSIMQMADDDSSMKGSIKSSKSSKTEETKSNHHHAVDVISDVMSDTAIVKKVPYLNTINRLEQSGKISRDEANKERALALSDSMKSNKSTQAFVEQAIQTHTQRRTRQMRDLEKSKREETLEVSQIKNLGQYGFTDVDVDETRIVGQKFKPNEEIKSGHQFDTQVIGDSGNISNQTGVLNEMPSKKRIGPDFSKFAQEKSHLVDDFTAKLIQIRQNKNQNVKLNETAERILQKLQKARQGADEAEEDLRHPDKSPFNNDGKSSTVVDDSSNLSAFPKGGADVPRSVLDVLQSDAWSKLVGGELSKKNLTADQNQYAQKILFDADAFINNFDSSSSSSSSSKSSKKGSKFPSTEKSYKPSKWSKNAQNDIVSEIMRQVKDNNGNYGQIDNLKIVDKDGKPISITDVINMIPKVVDNVSKIQGDIEMNKKLSDYKQQTEVFATKVVKQESNKFAVASGSAFRMRACC